MSEKVDKPFIQFIDKNYLLWDRAAMVNLRERYRVVGVLVGAFPGRGYQNAKQDLPLQLMAEEVKILVEHDAVEIVKLERLPTPEQISELEERQKNKCTESKELWVKEKRQTLMKNIDKIMAGQAKKKARNPDKTTPDLTREEVIELELNKAIKMFAEYEPIEITKMCRWPENFDIITNEWKFPETPQEIFRYRVYKDLWSTGRYLTNGFKFACDFLLYEGNPDLFHSSHMIFCLKNGQELSRTHLMACVRLSGQVNKRLVLTSERDGNIKYESVEFTGFGD